MKAIIFYLKQLFFEFQIGKIPVKPPTNESERITAEIYRGWFGSVPYEQDEKK